MPLTAACIYLWIRSNETYPADGSYQRERGSCGNAVGLVHASENDVGVRFLWEMTTSVGVSRYQDRRKDQQTEWPNWSTLY